MTGGSVPQMAQSKAADIAGCSVTIETISSKKGEAFEVSDLLNLL